MANETYVSIALDKDGDIWRYYDNELWKCVTEHSAKLTREELIEFHGPLLMIGGPYRLPAASNPSMGGQPISTTERDK